MQEMIGYGNGFLYRVLQVKPSRSIDMPQSFYPRFVYLQLYSKFTTQNMLVCRICWTFASFIATNEYEKGDHLREYVQTIVFVPT